MRELARLATRLSIARKTGAGAVSAALGDNVRLDPTNNRLQEKNVTTGLWHDVHVDGETGRAARVADQTGHT